ncbi:hypothetical protein J6590_099117 [Homalodisca vitripennis]|nr:hypothetical protein J6590_099117 [Homalodisca vitripennis]
MYRSSLLQGTTVVVVGLPKFLSHPDYLVTLEAKRKALLGLRERGRGLSALLSWTFLSQNQQNSWIKKDLFIKTKDSRTHCGLASVMCDCDPRTCDLCLGLASCAVTTPGLDSKQLLVFENVMFDCVGCKTKNAEMCGDRPQMTAPGRPTNVSRLALHILLDNVY